MVCEQSASYDDPQRFFGEQPSLLNYDELQPGCVVGSRLQQDPICSFVKAWVWQ